MWLHNSIVIVIKNSDDDDLALWALVYRGSLTLFTVGRVRTPSGGKRRNVCIKTLRKPSTDCLS